MAHVAVVTAHTHVLCFVVLTPYCLKSYQLTIAESYIPQNENEEDVINTVKLLYKEVCEEAKNTFETEEQPILLGKRHDPCSLDGMMHYSFNFA